MLFNTPGQEDYVIAAWTDDVSQNYSINIPSSSSSSFSVVSLYGNIGSATASKGYPIIISKQKKKN